MSFETMEKARSAKKTKPRLDGSTDMSGDLTGMSVSGLPIILPTPTLKQLKPMDYRPPDPLISPGIHHIPVPQFGAAPHSETAGSSVVSDRVSMLVLSECLCYVIEQAAEFVVHRSATTLRVLMLRCTIVRNGRQVQGFGLMGCSGSLVMMATCQASAFQQMTWKPTDRCLPTNEHWQLSKTCLQSWTKM